MQYFMEKGRIAHNFNLSVGSSSSPVTLQWNRNNQVNVNTERAVTTRNDPSSPSLFRDRTVFCVLSQPSFLRSSRGRILERPFARMMNNHPAISCPFPYLVFCILYSADKSLDILVFTAKLDIRIAKYIMVYIYY